MAVHILLEGASSFTKTSARVHAFRMNSPLLSPSSSDDDAISVVAHQGSNQSYSRTGTRSRVDNVRNSWRSTPSSSSNSFSAAHNGQNNFGSGAIGNGNERTSPASNLGANSFRSSSQNSKLSTPSVEKQTVVGRPVRPISIKDSSILRIEPIGSTDDTVTWSDTLGAVDAAESYSIRDPHFDLSTAKIMKLFSLSSPDGKLIMYS